MYMYIYRERVDLHPRPSFLVSTHVLYDRHSFFPSKLFSLTFYLLLVYNNVETRHEAQE